MSKYIIDTDQFEKLFETKAVAVLGIGDNLAVPEEGEKTVWTRMLNVADLEELTSDYINEHFGDLQDTAYQKGLNDGSLDVKQRVEGAYQKGLDEAWKAARRISVIELNGGLAGKELMKIYGTMDIHKIYDDNTASEAIEKLKAFEQKQDKIEVGDEVEVLNSGNKYLIAWFAGTSLCGFAHDGVTCRLQPSDVRKTGRHFDIQSILEDMRHD